MVREESHLDEMRAAIRGDFERLERRLGAQDLLQVAKPEELEELEEPDAPAEPEPVDAGEQPELPEPPAEQPRRSWLDRVLGR